MAAALHTYKERNCMSSDTSVFYSHQRSINDLPEEMLLEIFSYFEVEDLCMVIAKVSKCWYDLAKDLLLWKKITYSCDEESDISRVKEILTNAPALHSLIIHARQDAADILEILLSTHVNLRQLILENCNLGTDSTELLTNIVALYPDLESLSLVGCYPITSDGYLQISRLKQISEIRLSGCEGLSGKTVRLIVDSCQLLKKLSLCRVGQFDDDDLIHIITKLGKQLTALLLRGKSNTDIAYSSLNKCARLQHLAILNCEQITERGLMDGIGSLQELTSLCLHFCTNLTAKALSTFLNRPSMISLVSLNLSDCTNLDDEGMKGIAKRCIHLKELAVCSCLRITDAGIYVVISHCNQLRELDLTGLEHITGEGWLKKVPSYLPNLRLLNLSSCYDLHGEYLEELMGAVPELKVLK